MRFIREMTKESIQRACSAIFHNGHPFRMTIVYDGTVETGPYQLTWYEYRWGRLNLQLCPRGEIYLQAKGPRGEVVISVPVRDGIIQNTMEDVKANFPYLNGSLNGTRSYSRHAL